MLAVVLELLLLLLALALVTPLGLTGPPLTSIKETASGPTPPGAIMRSRCSTLARSSAFSRLRARISLDLASMCTTILFFTCRQKGDKQERAAGWGRKWINASVGRVAAVDSSGCFRR